MAAYDLAGLPGHVCPRHSARDSRLPVPSHHHHRRHHHRHHHHRHHHLGQHRHKRRQGARLPAVAAPHGAGVRAGGRAGGRRTRGRRAGAGGRGRTEGTLARVDAHWTVRDIRPFPLTRGLTRGSRGSTARTRISRTRTRRPRTRRTRTRRAGRTRTRSTRSGSGSNAHRTGRARRTGGTGDRLCERRSRCLDLFALNFRELLLTGRKVLEILQILLCQWTSRRSPASSVRRSLDNCEA